MSNKPKYPKVVVQLVGESDNAFMMIGRTKKALRAAGVEKAELDEFNREATSGDYDNVIQTIMKWVDVR